MDSGQGEYHVKGVLNEADSTEVSIFLLYFQVTDCMSDTDTDCGPSSTDEGSEHVALLFLMASNPTSNRLNRQVEISMSAGGLTADDDESTVDYKVTVALLDEDNNQPSSCYDSGFMTDSDLMTVREDRVWLNTAIVKDTCLGGDYKLVIQFTTADGTAVSSMEWNFPIR